METVIVSKDSYLTQDQWEPVAGTEHAKKSTGTVRFLPVRLWPGCEQNSLNKQLVYNLSYQNLTEEEEKLLANSWKFFFEY